MATKRKSKSIKNWDAELVKQAKQAEIAARRNSKLLKVPEANKDLHRIIQYDESPRRVHCTCGWCVPIDDKGVDLQTIILFGIHVLQAISWDIQQKIEMIGFEPMSSRKIAHEAAKAERNARWRALRA